MCNSYLLVLFIGKFDFLFIYNCFEVIGESWNEVLGIGLLSCSNDFFFVGFGFIIMDIFVNGVIKKEYFLWYDIDVVLVGSEGIRNYILIIDGDFIFVELIEVLE